MKPLALAFVLAGAPAAAQAAGYGLYEQGARALGQAGAFTARADDPSAIYFNPAGLSRIEGHALLLSPNLIVFKAQFAGVAPSPGFGVHEATKDKYFFPFAAYYAQGIGKKFAAGLGVYNAYGLEVEWQSPASYSGRFISTHSRIAPFSFVPTVAVALDERLRVGVGANLVLSSVRLNRHLAAFNPLAGRTEDIGEAGLESESNFGAGVNAGVQWWPSGKVRLGATYRGAVTIDYRGLADFRQRATGDPVFDAIVAATFPRDQAVTTRIPFPAQASLGIAWQSCPSWAFEANVNGTQWSAFDRLELRFPETPALDTSVLEDWDDALNVRVGTEYRKGGTAPWSFRAGYYFDQTPQPVESLGPLLPDTDRHGITLGLGTRGAHVAFDLYALVLFTPDRSTEGDNRDGYDGTYSTGTFVTGMSLGFTFP
jgi:long-chain fatty acid transport protein